MRWITGNGFRFNHLYVPGNTRPDRGLLICERSERSDPYGWVVLEDYEAEDENRPRCRDCLRRVRTSDFVEGLLQ